MKEEGRLTISFEEIILKLTDEKEITNIGEIKIEDSNGIEVRLESPSGEVYQAKELFFNLNYLRE